MQAPRRQTSSHGKPVPDRVAPHIFPAGVAGAGRELEDPASATSVIDTAVRRLNLVLAMLNFRRRPIYLSDDELAMDPRFHRYAIAVRRMPEVREVRGNFLGRALHTSPEHWQAQVTSILSNA